MFSYTPLVEASLIQGAIIESQVNDAIIKLIFSVATARSTLTGPIEGKEYTYRDMFDLPTTVTSACGYNTTLNIQSSFRLNNNGNRGGGFIGVRDSVSVPDFHLAPSK